ncbi:MAG: hypothetical protein ABIO77_01915 [Ginsengibacter sp.]
MICLIPHRNLFTSDSLHCHEEKAQAQHEAQPAIAELDRVMQ